MYPQFNIKCWAAFPDSKLLKSFHIILLEDTIAYEVEKEKYGMHRLAIQANYFSKLFKNFFLPHLCM